MSRSPFHPSLPELSILDAMLTRPSGVHLVKGPMTIMQSRTYSVGSNRNVYANYKNAMMFVRGLVAVNVVGWCLWQYSLISLREKRQKHPELQKQSWLERFDTPDWLLANATNSLQNIREGRYWTLLTSAFSHIGADHLIGT